MGSHDPDPEAAEGLDLEFDRSGSMLTVYCTGSIDVASEAAFVAEVRAHATNPTQVVLDLSTVTFCDSSGLRAFVRIGDHCAAIGARLVLFEPSRLIRRLLEITGLDQDLSIQGAAPKD